MHVISLGQAKNNDIINTTFDKTKTRQHSIHDPFEILQRCSSTQMAKTLINIKIFFMKINFSKCYIIVIDDNQITTTRY